MKKMNFNDNDYNDDASITSKMVVIIVFEMKFKWKTKTYDSRFAIHSTKVFISTYKTWQNLE